MHKKVMNLTEKRRRFRPLQVWEDREHARWFLYGAGTSFAVYVFLKLLFG